MSNYLSVAETAKLVRKQLAKNFPNVKFSVRSSSYAGGASINVSWVDGPTAKAVEAVTGQFTGADFDGMIDMKTHNTSWLMPDGSAMVARAQGTVGSMGVIQGEENAKPHPEAQEVSFGADYIFCNRKYSQVAMLKASLAVSEKYGMPPVNVEMTEWGPRMTGQNANLRQNDWDRTTNSDLVWKHLASEAA